MPWINSTETIPVNSSSRFSRNMELLTGNVCTSGNARCCSTWLERLRTGPLAPSGFDRRRVSGRHLHKRNDPRNQSVNQIAKVGTKILDIILFIVENRWRVAAKPVQSDADGWPGGVYAGWVPDNMISRAYLKNCRSDSVESIAVQTWRSRCGNWFITRRSLPTTLRLVLKWSVLTRQIWTRPSPKIPALSTGVRNPNK